MSTVSLADGALFAERYQIVRAIAAGGMGAVYEVIHLETRRRRALKVMHPQILQSDELRERFRQEAHIAASIESEFIVDIFDAGVDPATRMPFLVMELLRGEELGKLLRDRGRFTPVEVVTFLHQAALALDKMHRAHIVHRDLKPENLFVIDREGGARQIKILDFGIAKVVAENGTHANATRSIGTPLYMAPEQFQAGHQVSPLTDLYALAMMAYTLLVGKAYWEEESRGSGGNVFAFVNAVAFGPQETATARARRAGVPLPLDLDAWFAKATARAPEVRYSTATALVAALADALGVPRPGLERSGPLDLSAPPTSLLPTPIEELDARGSRASVSGASVPGLGATKAPALRRGRWMALTMGSILTAGALGAGGMLLLGVRSRPIAADSAGAPVLPAVALPSAQGGRDEPAVSAPAIEGPPASSASDGIASAKPAAPAFSALAAPTSPIAAPSVAHSAAPPKAASLAPRAAPWPASPAPGGGRASVHARD